MRRTLPLLCSVLVLVAFGVGIWFLTRPVPNPNRVAAVRMEIAALERERELLHAYLESPACAKP